MEHRFKIGDKVKIVDTKSVRDEAESQLYLGKESKIEKYSNANGYILEGIPYVWFDNELEAIESKVGLFEEIIKSIVEAAKNAPIIVERTEDGSVKVSPIEDDLPIDTPVICSTAIGINIGDWNLRYYAGKYRCFIMGNKSTSNSPLSKQAWDYIIPCDKFNFENPEESLKYNIVK